MPRPKSKQELLDLSQANYTKLLELVGSYTDEEVHKAFPEKMLNKNIRDVLAHLHHWHLMMLDWYKVGMSGEKPAMPAKGYTWKTVPQLNVVIKKTYEKENLEHIQSLLEGSYQQVQTLIQQHTDEELFEKKRYKWTGSTSLGSYLISSTSSHYDWAIRLIKKAMKTT